MLPSETIAALFPSPVKVGNLILRPLTVGGAALIDLLGVDVSKPVTATSVLACAFVLTLDDDGIRSVAASDNRAGDFAAWCRKANPDAAELADGVMRQISTAFNAFVPPKPDKGKSIYSTPTGYGWPLEIAECLAHEYGMTLDEAMCVPLARAYAMLGCARQRNCGETGGPTYLERPLWEKAKAQFRKAKAAAKDAEVK